MYQRHITGKEGEQEAVQYLKKKGYQILETNFFCQRGEIDIIALDKQELVFIEVKTRSNSHDGNPAEAVTRQKQKHIYKTAEYYLYVRNLEQEQIRIDVIEVYFSGQTHKIHHIPKAIIDQRTK